MKLLVTGGAGFIGSNFVNYCIETGSAECYVVDCLTYAGDLGRIRHSIKFFEQDIATANMRYILQLVDPDAVVNFAAHSHVDNSIYSQEEFIHSNYTGVYNLLRSIRSYNERLNKDVLFCQISTDEVWGDLPEDSTRKFVECDPLKPNNPYAATKAAADLLIRAYSKTYNDFRSVICRASNNFGPGQHQEKLLPTIITKAYNNESLPIYGTGSNVREWLYVDDFSRGILKALNLPPYHQKALVLGFGSKNAVSNINVAKKVLKFMNKPNSLISFVEDRKGHDRKYSVNYEKAKTLLGWEPEVDLDSGLKIVIEDVVKRLV